MPILEYGASERLSSRSTAAVILWISGGLLPLLWVPAQFWYELNEPIDSLSVLRTFVFLCLIPVVLWLAWVVVFWFMTPKHQSWQLFFGGLTWATVNCVWLIWTLIDVLDEPSVRWLLS